MDQESRSNTNGYVDSGSYVKKNDYGLNDENTIIMMSTAMMMAITTTMNIKLTITKLTTTMMAMTYN